MIRLPLDVWRNWISFHPWHFWQMSNQIVPVNSKCNGIVMQRSYYDSEAAGRVDLVKAIEDANTKLTRHLRYSPAPHYVIEHDIIIDPSRPAGWSAVGSGVLFGMYFPLGSTFYGGAGGYAKIQLQEGWVRSLGTEQLDLIGNAAVTRSDPDGDTLEERFNLTVATTVTDPNEIALFFAAADRLNSDGPIPQYEIAPIGVSIATGVATITGPGWLLVKPLKYEGFGQAASLDPSDATNFVTTLDVYRRTTNTANPVTVTAIQSSCCSSAETTTLTTATLEDPGNGILRLSGFCGCSNTKRVTVRYLAGYPLEGRQMDSKWLPVASKLAAAELARGLCACDQRTGSALFELQFDMAISSGMVSTQYNLSESDLNNPFGTRRGQIEAWRIVRGQYHTIGFLP